MKLELATLATTIALATGASAMVGPYERAVNEDESGLFTQGAEARASTTSHSDSPVLGFTRDGVKQVTLFSADADAERQFNGYEGR